MEKYSIRVIRASEGRYLTDGETICTVINLAPSASEDDWREISEEEKQEIERKHEEEMIEREMNNDRDE